MFAGMRVLSSFHARMSNVGRAGRAGGRPRRGGAAAGHRRGAGGGVAPARGKTALGLTAGPVPPRVDADVKAGLLALVDHATDAGWSTGRAARCSAWTPSASPAGRPAAPTTGSTTPPR